MAELRVHNGVEPGDRINFGVFDPVLLCDYSECLISEFEDVKCSRDLGYGRADTGEMSITLLQDGRVNMRRVDSKDQVLKVFDKIERAILGSTMCNCCGNDLVSIASGLVAHQDAHTVLQCGSSIKLDCEILKPRLSNSLFNTVFNAPHIAAEFDGLANQMLECFDSLSSENLQAPFAISSKLKCDLISLVFENNTRTKQSLLLRMLSLEWILQSALHALFEISSILESLSSDDQVSANEILRSSSKGEESVAPSLNQEELFKVYALSRCLARCRKAIEDWLSG